MFTLKHISDYTINIHEDELLPEQIEREDINRDAELISDLIYIEQIQRGGQKLKFRDLTDYMEPWNMVRLLN
jgi:hypothetical protein